MESRCLRHADATTPEMIIHISVLLLTYPTDEVFIGELCVESSILVNNHGWTLCAAACPPSQ